MSSALGGRAHTDASGVRKVKVGGNTPITVLLAPEKVIFFPMMPGSLRKRSFHRSSLRTRQSGQSCMSPGTNRRPRDALMPSISKRLGDILALRASNLSPPASILETRREYAAMALAIRLSRDHRLTAWKSPESG